MVNAPQSSAAGLLALLDEDGEPEIQTYALQKLNESLDVYWAEISDYIPKIEALHESPRLPQNFRELAALVVSKLYYHLGAFDESLAFALRAGEHLDPSNRSEYTNTVVEKCIDSYVDLRTKADGIDPDLLPGGDKRMRLVVERMFDRCLQDHEYKHVIGIALESRRLDVLEKVLKQASDPALLSYVLEAAMTVVPRMELRKRILRVLIPFFSTDYFSLTQCFVHLNDPTLATNLLHTLLTSGDQEKRLVAYQIGFDLVETASQEFLNNVRRGLGGSDASATAEDEGMQVDEAREQENDAKQSQELAQICRILTGVETIKLYLQFLKRNNRSNNFILSNTKESLEIRASIYNSALTFSHAYAHAGTTNEEFLRGNLDWLGKASSWSKFSATAALGVIHKGNLNKAFNILEPYLPKTDMTPGASFYSEGGSLFALGLIHSRYGRDIISYLRQFLVHPNEIIQHGAALGVGVAAMATGDEGLYEELRGVLFNDNAVAGEAAGYAIGMVMMGTASQKALEEMLQYAHETQHEKIIRGLGIGLSLLFVGLQEEADWLIQTLTSDQDPLLRYGGIYTIALAYAGTGKNRAIQQLLHVAVSDVNDDVRRAAVTGLGFILFRDPSQVPRVVQLLSESYNPNVRYGATLALGISCAGTGLGSAIELLEPMTKDSVDFVRQGANIALAMIMIQQNEVLNPKVNTVRKNFVKVISDKHEDAMAKFGATVSQGIIDAGGRNATISMQSTLGNANVPAIVGMAMFTQFWYWFPMAHFLSLAFTPTAVIGVTEDLKVPKFSLISNARPSLFAYYLPARPKQKETVERAAPAVLSTTAKASARQKTRDKEKAEAMETDEGGHEEKEEENKGDENMEQDQDRGGEEPTSGSNTADTSVSGTFNTTEGGTDGANSTSKQSKQRAEASHDVISNFSRAVPAQFPHISFPPDSKYFPVRPLVSQTAAVPRPTAPPTPTPSKGTRAGNGTGTGTGTGGSVTPVNGEKISAATASSSTKAVSAHTASHLAGNGAGGGIIVLKDAHPDQEAEFFEFQEDEARPEQQQDQQQQSEGAQRDQGAGGGSDVDTSGPIADPPPPFEYPFPADEE